MEKKCKFLVLNFKYYDLIKAGKKSVELRKHSFSDINQIKFQRGYVKDAEQMTVDVVKVFKLDNLGPQLKKIVVEQHALYDGDLNQDFGYGYQLNLNTLKKVR